MLFVERRTQLIRQRGPSPVQVGSYRKRLLVKACGGAWTDNIAITTRLASITACDWAKFHEFGQLVLDDKSHSVRPSRSNRERNGRRGAGESREVGADGSQREKRVHVGIKAATAGDNPYTGFRCPALSNDPPFLII
jgi:hypothetical protein